MCKTSWPVPYRRAPARNWRRQPGLALTMTWAGGLRDGLIIETVPPPPLAKRSLHSTNALSSDSSQESTGEIGDFKLAVGRPGSKTADYLRFVDLQGVWRGWLVGFFLSFSETSGRPSPRPEVGMCEVRRSYGIANSTGFETGLQ